MKVDQMASLMAQTCWEGSFPVLRGGVVTFSLKPKQPFCISVRPDPDFSPAGKTLINSRSQSNWPEASKVCRDGLSH